MPTKNQPAGRAFPPGGDTGDVLTKASSDDQDIVWAAPGSIGGSLAATDGTTTVNPATSLRFPAGTLTDEGAGEAAVLISVLRRSVTLTDAQIKALPSTSVELIAAPGADKMILTGAYDNVAVSDIFISHHQVVPYDNVAADTYFKVRLGSAFNAGFVGFGGLAGTDIGYLLTGQIAPDAVVRPGPPIGGAPGANQASDWVNQPVMLDANNSGLGDYTGGDSANTLTVTILYSVLDL